MVSSCANEPMPAALPDSSHDAAIIGAGVIGCAIARRLTLEGWKVAVLEKARDVLDGASKSNSAILHTGFDAPVGSLEQRCVAAGYAEYRAIHRRLNLPLIESGALVIAWSADQEAALPALMDQARANGVDVAPLTAAETRALEPGLGPGVAASFRVPGESLIDPWSAPHAYLLQAVENGATLLRDCTVTGGNFDQGWHLETTRGTIRARVTINAAGLYGDQIDQMLTGAMSFRIKPRKGQFIVYDKPAAALAGHVLLPVPTAVTKGVVICRTAYGNLLVGPTAEEQDDRETAALVPETLDALRLRGEEILPGLAGCDITAIYAGLRPATQFKDYQISKDAMRNYICVGGIRSTGLSSALGTAHYVHDLCADMVTATSLPDPAWPQMSNITQGPPRSCDAPDNGGIVCHCELVTRAEIAAALASPIAPQTLAGLKRMTRVTMGRCQGNYCAGEIAAMMARS